MHAYGTYCRGLRHLARRLKDGKPSAVKRAAEIFAAMLPKDAVIVPMPSHTGRAEAMLAVAMAIGTLRGDISVRDALECDPHGGMYAAKKSGFALPAIVMRQRESIPCGRAVCVIDNVIDTGATFQAARNALTAAELYAIATTNNTKGE